MVVNLSRYALGSSDGRPHRHVHGRNDGRRRRSPPKSPSSRRPRAGRFVAVGAWSHPAIVRWRPGPQPPAARHRICTTCISPPGDCRHWPRGTIVTSTDGITYKAGPCPVRRASHHRGNDRHGWNVRDGIGRCTQLNGATDQCTRHFNPGESRGIRRCWPAPNDVIYLSDDGVTGFPPITSPPTTGWVTAACAAGNTVVAGAQAAGSSDHVAPCSHGPGHHHAPQAHVLQTG